MVKAVGTKKEELEKVVRKWTDPRDTSHQLWNLFKLQNVKTDAQIKVPEGFFSFILV